MREIKLKAWIPDIQRMYQVMSIDIEPQNGRQKYVTVWEHPSLESAIIKNKVGRFRLGDGVEIVQYTGIKDKGEPRFMRMILLHSLTTNGSV